MQKIQTAISSDLCIRLTWNFTGTSWYGGKTIPRWQTAAILKIDILLYLSVKSSDFYDVIKKWKSCIGHTPSLTERISCSKTTTLLPSAKCTRPLFQGRTGCGGRPSGWHDIVTCQRLVIIIIIINSTMRLVSQHFPFYTSPMASGAFQHWTASPMKEGCH